MSVTVLPRKFKYNQLVLDDPDFQMSPESVKEFYSGIYPELTQAIIDGPEIDDKSVEYTFRRAVGTKGATGKGKRKKSTRNGKKDNSISDSIGIMESLSNIIDRQSTESTPVFPPSAELEPV